MSDVKLAYGSVVTLTHGLNSLAAAALSTSDAIDNTTTLYEDILVEVLIADFAEAGNVLVPIYASSSMDGSSYSRADAANIGMLASVGHMSIIGTGAWRSRAFSLRAAFRGTLPPYTKIHAYNDAGATLASSGNGITYRGVYRTITA